MSQFQSSVEEHYYQDGIFEKILKLLKEQGKERITREEITQVDEFHVRGAAVSVELAEEAGFDKNTRVLDVGCGIGGPARMLAAIFGCKVTGIDITEEFIRTAKLLSRETGLDEQTEFITGNALQLPFNNESFDVVWTQHAQMNIKDKGTFYSEICRVLKKAGRFIYYDIFSINHETLYFPVPWAMNRSLSFLMTINELNGLLTELGLLEITAKDETMEAIQFFREMKERSAKEDQPGPGMYILMGKNTNEMLAGLVRNINEKKIELQSGIYRKLQ
jgi:ubiquinone/menaquinone biosynthesis C-methylase UbiE